MTKLTRRRVLAGSTTALVASGFVRSAQAAPAAEGITRQLIEAAKKEGKVTWYSSVRSYASRAVSPHTTSPCLASTTSRSCGFVRTAWPTCLASVNPGRM